MPKVVRLPRTSDNLADPLDINLRLYKQISELLTDLEQPEAGQRITMRERIAAIIAIGRIQTIFVGLRKENLGVGSGSTVRKYAAAFKNDASGRKKIAGPPPEPDEPDDWFERADIAADDSGDDTD
jgi:hypothetical protein